MAINGKFKQFKLALKSPCSVYPLSSRGESDRKRGSMNGWVRRKKDIECGDKYHYDVDVVLSSRLFVLK